MDNAPVELNNLLLDRAEVKNFFNKYSFTLHFNDRATFLIGYNGTGKTTLINLIRASLEGDTTTLSGILFESITLYFRGHKNTKPRLEITKKHSTTFCFSFYPNATTTDFLFRVEGFADSDHGFIEEFDLHDEIDDYDSIEALLKPLFNFSWLSITRSAKNARTPSRSTNPIDHKLNEFIHGMTTYISSLSNRYADANAVFTNRFFLSLLDVERTDFQQFLKLDLDNEKYIIQQILKEVNVPAPMADSNTSKFFSSLNRNSDQFSPEDYVLISNALRLHRLVDAWVDKDSKRKEIFQFLDSFRDVINNNFLRKTLEIDARNRPIFRDDNNRHLPISNLSSGEKQMLILLGEALLQEQRPTIYMADEPELSLHIKWQESLVSNIISMNPSAQIVFATHSPDIISTYSDGAIHMSELF